MVKDDIQKPMIADTLLERHALRMLLDRSRLASAMHILVGLLIAGFMVSAASVPVWRGVVFALGLSGAVLFQMTLARRQSTEDWSDEVFGSIKRQFDLYALMVGLMWGFSGFCLFPSQEPALQLFLTFVMGGMSLSAVGTQGMSLKTCYFSVIPGMTPLGIRYLIEGGLTGLLSGGLIFLYVIVLISFARKINDFMLQAFRLQIEKEGLLEDLRNQASELDEARLSAEEANLAKSRFLAQASHDLRQPLHAISLFVESLPEARNTEMHESIMNRVRQSLDVLTKLFDSLLDVTLLDTGGIIVRKTVFRPSDIIAEVVRDFGLVAEACRVELRVVQSDMAVKSDPVLVRRMLQNLISNAIRHTEGGRVLIGCRRRSGKVAIDIVDTGPGIGKDDRQKIFSEFTRLDETRMGEGAEPGLGLGLSIVKRVASEIGLVVRLTSEVGRGSVFRIDGFEIADAKMIDLQQRGLPQKGVVEGASVLVLDDDPDTLEATELLLKKWGCQVEAALGWQGFASGRPDVVICDYELSPKITGLDVIAEINRSSLQPVPAIMISGHTSKELQQATAALGIPLLHKPVRPAQLRSALLNALVRSGEPA